MTQTDNETLKNLLKDSQTDHRKYTEADSELVKKDAQRIKEIIELLRNGQIKSANDFLIASLIFQYSQTLSDLEEGFRCAVKAVELGIPPHESLVPQTTDKLLVAKQIRVGIHKSLAKQKFGTQIALWMDNGKTISFCPLDGTVTQQELNMYGLPDCRQFEGKPYKDYAKALEEAKQKAAQAWQANHK